MKKIIFLCALVVAACSLRAGTPPDEGMWLPMFIGQQNYGEMQRLGLQLTPEQIYDINHSSLKDAIVQLGDFCTGEIISENGLMLTNHHCGYGSVAEHSSVEHDYLKNGFWAKNNDEELPNEGLTATFLVRMEDVTATVLAEVTDSTKKAARDKKVTAAIRKLQEENSEQDRYKVSVLPFYEGNAYYMFVYEVFKDVRLVGAPPSSIGKFGGDTDNWMWPRHTGDFSIFRIYTAPDGSPAEYAPENVPLRPKYFLPINIGGIHENDYAMIMGYPGSTDRFMTSYEIRNFVSVDCRAVVQAFDALLPVMHEEMLANDAVRIAYAETYASFANAWKNYQGKAISLEKLKIADKKSVEEEKLAAWINADDQRKAKYGNPLAAIEKICKKNNAEAMTAFYTYNCALSVSRTMFLPYKLHFCPSPSEKTFSEEKKQSLLSEYREAMKGTDAATEEKIVQAMLELFSTLPAEYRPDIDELINKKYKGEYELFAQAVVEKSICGTEENFRKFLNKPSKKVYDNDPLIAFYNAILMNIMKAQGNYTEFSSKLKTPRRRYLAALQEMENHKAMYPDANFTMRCTYGTVKDYDPADGIHYKYFTTEKGILEKEIPGDAEFEVDERLKELLETRDFGRYADKQGYLPVCFLTDNDITGGNSGSPVLNAKGELIGCAFDGNIEALSSDIAYDEKLQRCINVDIRYVLFVIDKYAGAQRLIDEMKIVTD